MNQATIPLAIMTATLYLFIIILYLLFHRLPREGRGVSGLHDRLWLLPIQGEDESEAE